MDGNPFWESGRSTDRTLHERRRWETATLLAGCLEMCADDGRLTPRDCLRKMHFDCFAGRPFGRAPIPAGHRDPSGRRVAIVKYRDDGLSVGVLIILLRRERSQTTPESPLSGVTNAPIFPTSPHSGDTNDLPQSDPTIHYRHTAMGQAGEDSTATAPQVP